MALLLAYCSVAVADRQQDIESFEQVWKTVRDKHWDASLGGLDWQRVHDQLRPKVERAHNIREVRAVLGDMLGHLHQSHFGIIPAEAYREMETPGEAPEGVTGIEVRVIGGSALVVAVRPGSPAAEAGVKPGWEILAVDGKTLAPSLKRVSRTYEGSTLKHVMLARAAAGRLSGGTGTDVMVRFRDGGEQTVEKRIAREKPRGNLVRFGYLPPVYVWAESRRIDGRVGYVRFNMFMDPAAVMPVIEDAVKACMSCDGFIIDLRGNPGGIGAMAMGVAGWFVDTGGKKLGTMKTRDSEVNFVISPRPEVFRGKLAVLIDGSTGSTSEIFSGGMQDLGRARIFGSRSAGAALPSAIERLPNGDGFQYAVANYISEGGKPLEGKGVIPDVAVSPTRASLLAGRDSALDAALEWMNGATGAR